ncbi:MAG TPA: cysteine peptidase family C39 domain-containing protein [Kofleriaceae bacterium]|jgi:ABC-type bacteriocin/lantibiotic exporter with double-glycine peptidase domain|nr:cysteine peptidase family C39 domain-containing protein [Kofleriaceae bacterium]
MRAIIRSARVIALCGLICACAVPYRGGARAVQPTQLDNATWYQAAETPVVLQKQMTDCGLAALAMVAGAWGRHWSIDDLAHRVPPGKHGVKLGTLRDLARSRGLEAYAIKANRQDLQTELSAGRPVLLGLILPHDRKRNRSHYEVAIAMNRADGTVITIDPATGEWMRRSPAVLDLEWKAAGYAALVVTADKQAETASK